MKYQIKNVRTFIKDKVQHVDFELANSNIIVSDTYDSIKKIFNNISILEIEILNDEWLELINYEILWNQDIEMLRKMKMHTIKSFSQIMSIKLYTNKVGKECVIIETTNNNSYFSRINYFTAACGLNSKDFEILKGAYISPVFYDAGIHMDDDLIFIKNNNMIIKNFNFRVFGSIEANYNDYFNKRILL